ncbi:hypothetical protein EVAR_20488_1 [Eumeta japonica]|uniref:Histone-lysine N-methyltransferase SETMAR n=1 Tax=Eumeta variegata TaxID=151549 RepID=A0A4C1Y646_EUMVA|nr:hypothetical protein EVAR_20488_1 [Eumeta japonica]
MITENHSGNRMYRMYISRKTNHCFIDARDQNSGGSVNRGYIDQLTSTSVDEAPSTTTAYHWFSEFDRGRSMPTDAFKEGRPKSIVVTQNIDAVRERIIQHHNVTYREIKTSLGIKVFEDIRKNNRQRRIILYHDNTSCHTSAETTRFLEGRKIDLMGHPPYNLDLAPD